MIENVAIKNFKSLKSVSCELKSLTLLSGLNSCGKSSLIQALRIYSAAAKGEQCTLKGHGAEKNLITEGAASGASPLIQIGQLTELEFVHLFDPPTPELNLCYLSADRFGPRPYLEIDPTWNNETVIGEFGENVAAFIDHRSGISVPEDVLHSEDSNEGFDEQIYEWLQDIAPGTEIVTKTISENDISCTQINGYRPTNVGYGLSYALPVIAAALGLPETYIFAVENPEAHLHPAGQTAMGRLLAKAAATGLQVIVETHSDHLLNGIRLAIKNGELSNDDAIFHYFSLDDRKHTSVETIHSDSNGKLTDWPKGFFDQGMINLGKLAARGR
ncbi:MAG: DUF3696 domain-containing protein [Halodesulfovibrio sp.]|uniref:AAA family ATPase n=1 Tax=Halodesulfovibrio sp. TaxID=1912772 RepID=UPI00359DE3C2